MNPFFSPNPEYLPEVPRRAYARFEDAEPAEGDERGDRLLVFSAASADWIDENGGNLFRLDDPTKCAAAWQAYWSTLFRFSRGEENKPFDAFAGIPLFRYEISLSRKDKEAYAEYLRFANEGTWLLIERDPSSHIVADIYRNIFTESEAVRISASRVEDRSVANSLTQAFDMTQWPDSDNGEIKEVLDAVAREAFYFAAYDVGQGAATALLRQDHSPFLYYDLGAGITRNKHTTPTNLQFCWSHKPPIILSHWDMDHWAGANKDREAKRRVWIVPRQSIGSDHTVFANEVLHDGGKILVWRSGSGCIKVKLCPGQELVVDQCTSTRKNDRNGSGLAIRVDQHEGGELRHWIATGDAGYQDLPFRIDGEIVALMVPHHGAKMRTNHGSVPQRTSGKYARLIYSYGRGNAHGKAAVRHPTQESVAEHELEGWDTGQWSGNPTPGFAKARGDVLATAEHQRGNLGGIIVGWDKKATIGAAPCGLKGRCTTTLDQS